MIELLPPLVNARALVVGNDERPADLGTTASRRWPEPGLDACQEVLPSHATWVAIGRMAHTFAGHA